jgi:hypothetical protein
MARGDMAAGDATGSNDEGGHTFRHPSGNGFQATIRFDGTVSISSAETYPSISEANTAAATKLLNMPDRIEWLDADHPLSFEQLERYNPR